MKPNDVLILTSDGVHDNLTTPEISKVISSSHDSNEIVNRLVNEASLQSQDPNNFRHKYDDITAMSIKVEDPKFAFHPKIGDKINVQRSSGVIESGWSIFRVKDGKISVRKTLGNNDFINKTIPINDLYRFNRQPKIEDISTSADLHQLFFTLKKMEKIQGSSQVFTSDMLIEIINKYREGKIGLNGITHTYGLRETVDRLTKK
jgi:hypothetical protein